MITAIPFLAALVAINGRRPTHEFQIIRSKVQDAVPRSSRLHRDERVFGPGDPLLGPGLTASDILHLDA
ncbi:MAG: hypothetical protein ACRD3N_11440 [Terracidiphilus sp.]